MEVPWRVESERLLLRPWLSGEGERLGAAIAASLDHLRTHLNWAMSEPATLPKREARIARNRAAFAAGERFAFGIFGQRGEPVLGGIGLEPIEADARGTFDPRVALEIGYWLGVDATGRGLATEAAGALTRVAFELRAVERVEIHCDPRNLPSAAIAQRLGYRHLETLVDARLDPRGEPRDTLIWEMTRGAYPSAAVASQPLRVLGRDGESLL